MYCKTRYPQDCFLKNISSSAFCNTLRYTMLLLIFTELPESFSGIFFSWFCFDLLLSNLLYMYNKKGKLEKSDLLYYTCRIFNLMNVVCTPSSLHSCYYSRMCRQAWLSLSMLRCEQLAASPFVLKIDRSHVHVL